MTTDAGRSQRWKPMDATGWCDGCDFPRTLVAHWKGDAYLCADCHREQLVKVADDASSKTGADT